MRSNYKNLNYAQKEARSSVITTIAIIYVLSLLYQAHSPITSYEQPKDAQWNASFPTEG